MNIDNSGKRSLSSSQEDFLRKEVDKLNAEVENLLADTPSREKYSLTIIAGVTVWLFAVYPFRDYFIGFVKK